MQRNVLLLTEARGICHRYNYAIEKTRLKRSIDGAAADDVDDDSHDDNDDDDGLLMYTCDDVGGYEKKQCHDDECWSVSSSGLGKEWVWEVEKFINASRC